MDGVDAFDEGLRATGALTSNFVGLNKAEASTMAAHHRLHLRVVDLEEVPEEEVALTLDLRPDRVTVYFRDGSVTRADAG
jgi:hypothetical protein